VSFKTFTKELVLRFAGTTGAYRLLGGRLSGVATILVLHRVVRQGTIVLDPAHAVSEAFLDAAIDHVLRLGCTIVTIDELQRRVHSGTCDQHMVVFTFDDGYADNITVGARIFEKYRAPWTLYLTTGFPDQQCAYWWGALERALLDHDRLEIEMPNHRRIYSSQSIAQKRLAFTEIAKATISSREALLRYLRDRYAIDAAGLLHEHSLSWDQVRELVASGMVELGGHTVTHPSLPLLDSESARRELTACRSRIHEMTGVDVLHFAYPYGAAGPREYTLAKSAGFKTASTAIASNLYCLAGDQTYALPRIRLDGRDERRSQIDVHLSGLTGLISLRARHPIWTPGRLGRAHRPTVSLTGVH
jgi:peptidoglycan/xylan/chitin deacetylase (PgdA/CDA1 family)